MALPTSSGGPSVESRPVGRHVRRGLRWSRRTRCALSVGSPLQSHGGGGMSDRPVMGRPLTRRTFIKAAGAAGAGFVMYAYLPGGTLRALAQIPGGTLDPLSVPKYQTPLLIPPVMPRAGVLTNRGGKPVDYYEISMRQFVAADPACRSARHHGLGVRRGGVAEQTRTAGPQRALADDRGEVEPSGPGQVDQRARGRAAGTSCRICCRWTRRCTGRTHPEAWAVATSDPRSPRPPGATPARCRW